MTKLRSPRHPAIRGRGRIAPSAGPFADAFTPSATGVASGTATFSTSAGTVGFDLDGVGHETAWPPARHPWTSARSRPAPGVGIGTKYALTTAGAFPSGVTMTGTTGAVTATLNGTSVTGLLQMAIGISNMGNIDLTVTKGAAPVGVFNATTPTAQGRPTCAATARAAPSRTQVHACSGTPPHQRRLQANGALQNRRSPPMPGTAGGGITNVTRMQLADRAAVSPKLWFLT